MVSGGDGKTKPLSLMLEFSITDMQNCRSQFILSGEVEVQAR